MARTNDGTASGAPTAGGQECMPCRGTGSIVSRLGGESNTLPCPWCAGTGVRQPGIDAQAAWLAHRAEHGEPDGGQQPEG